MFSSLSSRNLGDVLTICVLLKYFHIYLSLQFPAMITEASPLTLRTLVQKPQNLNQCGPRSGHFFLNNGLLDTLTREDECKVTLWIKQLKNGLCASYNGFLAHPSFLNNYSSSCKLAPAEKTEVYMINWWDAWPKKNFCVCTGCQQQQHFTVLDK